MQLIVVLASILVSGEIYIIIKWFFFVCVCALSVFLVHRRFPRRIQMPWAFVTILWDVEALFYIFNDYCKLQLFSLLFVLHCCWYQDLFDAKFKTRNGFLNG